MVKKKDTNSLIPDLTIHMRKVEDLIPYARNVSTHDDAQIALIASSIKEYKFRNPIIVTSDGGIKAGHGRVLAARKLGMTEVPCLYADDLTDMQLRGYILMDNKARDLAGTDTQMLGMELADMRDQGFDLALTGYDEIEIEQATSLLNQEEETEPDFVPNLPDADAPSETKSKFVIVISFSNAEEMDEAFLELKEKYQNVKAG